MLANPARGRSFAYAALSLGLLAVRVPGWGSETHTFLEAIATVLALVIGAMALVYYSQKTASYLILGTGFLGAALLDGFHAVVTSSFCTECTPTSLSALIP